MSAQPKMRECPICRGFYQQFSTLKPGCSSVCRAEIKRQKDLKRAARDARVAKRKALVGLRTVRDWIALAQVEVNRYCRLRDANEGCCSCHMPQNYGGRWHASHYMPAGNNSAIRFDYKNINKGCAQCNTHKSGNRGPYRVKLIAKIGLAEVERLEGPKELKRWTVEELVAIRKQARADWKALKQEKS